MMIILVEDDHRQANFMARHLEHALGGRVEIILTESEFRRSLKEIRRNPPRAFVIDMMLRWTVPHPGMPVPPKEVEDGGRERAGFRCRELLAASDVTSDIPVVLYSVVDRSHFESLSENLPPSTVYLQKDSDLEPLCEAIRELTEGSHRGPA